jgi:hypothetical protein
MSDVQILTRTDSAYMRHPACTVHQCSCQNTVFAMFVKGSASGLCRNTGTESPELRRIFDCTCFSPSYRFGGVAAVTRFGSGSNSGDAAL